MTETVTSLATDGEPALTPREWPEPARLAPFPCVLAKVPSLNRELTLSLGGRNWSLCPKAGCV
jgi:hypothetical protein